MSPKRASDPSVIHLRRLFRVWQLARCRARLKAESDQFLAAQLADAINPQTLKRHQGSIPVGLADIKQRLREHDEQDNIVDTYANRAV